jgi:NAD(P)-dependent dehydrogenase (short-subunit alcohol dehydrogenase family)
MTINNYVIIGGSSGIGYEITRRLSVQGHNILVGSRTSETLHDLKGVRHFNFDVLNDPLSSDILPETIQGLVYCPGTIRLRPLRALKEEDFLLDYRLNVLGAVKSVKACLNGLKKSKNGAAIVLFSTVAVRIGLPFHASIASAKGAIEGLTRSLAAELAPRIRVNAVAPSLTDTPLSAQLLSSEEKRSASADRHPLRRIGKPQDIANAVMFMIQDSSEWITGQILGIDGGLGSLSAR